MHDVIDQLACAGLLVDGLEIGRLVRCKVEGDTGSKRSGWYVLHEISLDSGDRVLVGRYGNWKRFGGESLKIDIDREGLSAAEQQRLQAEQQRLREQAEAEKQDRAKNAVERARKMWPRLSVEGKSEYLDRKKVRAFGIRFLKRSIVVPVRTFDGLVGLQFIDADGTPRFLTGTPKRAAFHVIGRHDPHTPIVFAEGYATSASIHMATGLSVVVCFDAGNVLPVARLFREKFPEQRFVIAADNDIETAGNPGLTKAFEAARAVRAHLAWPDFTKAKTCH